MKKLIYLFAVIIIAVAVNTCAKGLGNADLNKTGLFDQSGNLISDTMIYTNRVSFTGNIPAWATNIRFDYTVIDNGENFEIKYTENVLTPNLPFDPSDYYKVFVPYTKGAFYHTVSYKDTNRLNQLWFDQINRKGQSDGKVFAIRNRDNNGGVENNDFQKTQGSRYDYYYFKDNGDIVYKGGDKSSYSKEILVKRFVGAVIVDYRKVKEETNPEKGIFRKDEVTYTGEWTIGAIYKMAIDVNEARERFKGGGSCEGVYNFIGVNKWTYFNQYVSDRRLFIRQFFNTNFMEVLILNPYNNHDVKNCLGVQAYYAYYGSYDSKEGDSIVAGFTHENYPYMTDEKLYLGKRPEEIVPLLSYTTTFTENVYNWKFLAIPGHKY